MRAGVPPRLKVQTPKSREASAQVHLLKNRVNSSECGGLPIGCSPKTSIAPLYTCGKWYKSLPGRSSCENFPRLIRLFHTKNSTKCRNQVPRNPILYFNMCITYDMLYSVGSANIPTNKQPWHLPPAPTSLLTEKI